MIRPVPIAAGLLVAALPAIAAVVPVGATQPSSASKALSGTFKLAPGSYSRGRARGTYFRMIYPGGRRYFPNPDSRAADKTYNLGRPGRDGGIVLGRFQSPPDPPFDASGNARANRIIRPGSFTAIDFSVATPRTDPQSRRRVAAPSARVDGRRLTVRLPGYTVAWNNQFFNQGAPKPDGSGRPATGTYDPDTKRFAFTWTSKVVGGPFNGFSGFWHFEGTFSPR